MQTGYRIGSTMEFVGYDTSISRKRLALLTSAAEKYLIDPHCEPVQEEWYGWRPITWDDKPVIDRSPAMDNVWVAVGHSMLGVSMAPATGRLIADLVSGSSPHLDPAPFSAARFQRP
jgi:D-amino-acid dehydrogenase